MQEFFRGFLGRFLRLVLALVVGLGILFFLMQRSMIYYPMRASLAEQEDLAKHLGLLPWRGMEGSVIGWRTSAPPGGATARMVIFHGNAGFALHREGLIRLLQKTELGARMEFFVFEYPGYGAREGQPSEAHFLATARAALAELSRAGQEVPPLVLLGESLGTGVASALAAAMAESVRGVILLTPFDSLVSVARHHFPWLPVGLILRDRYDARAVLPQFSGPVVFVLAEQDEVVPAKYGQDLARAFPGPQRIFLVPGSDHNGVVGLLQRSQWEEILDFALHGKARLPGSSEQNAR